MDGHWNSQRPTGGSRSTAVFFFDIDSESPACFNEAEHSAVAHVADALATLL
jgi:putative methionine-R-sulfoxide reductase with GAF domain